MAATDCEVSNSIRCDARYFTHNTLEIFFRTGDNESSSGISKSPTVYSESACMGNCNGTNPCLWKNGKPTRNILHAPLGVGGLVAKNFVFVKDSEKNLDQAIILKGLEANTIYHIYCHMDDMVNDISDVLKVWTGESNLLTDVSFVSSDTTMGATAIKTTLTFTHEAFLTNNAVIKIIAYRNTYYSDTGDIFKTDVDDGQVKCTATTTTPTGTSSLLILDNVGTSSEYQATTSEVSNKNVRQILLNGTSLAPNLYLDARSVQMELEYVGWIRLRHYIRKI